MSYITGTGTELIFANATAYTAKASFTSEVAINDTGATVGDRPSLPPYFFAPGYSTGKTVRFVARGIVSSTGTPTYTFTIRLGSTASTTAAIVLGTAALTTTSGAANRMWELAGDIKFNIMGASGANSTVVGAGFLTSPLGFASPGVYEAWGGATQPGTVATVDASITNYFNVNVTCSASSASNTIQLLQLLISGLN